MNKLTDYKALLFDIDGTLAKKDGTISDEIIDNLNKLIKAGYMIGVCTGRGYGSITNILPLFPSNALHIVSGGSAIISTEGKINWDSPIDSKVVQELINYCRNSEIMASFKTPEAHYATGKMLVNLQSNSTKYVTKELSTLDVSKVGTIFFANLKSEDFKFIKKHPKLSHKHMIGNSGKPYLDITAKGVNKSTALKKWSEFTNVPLSKIIGFGDSLNDIEFLETCGFSVAMGNALDEVKEIADKTIGNVSENGLEIYLSKLLEGENLWVPQSWTQEKKLQN